MRYKTYNDEIEMAKQYEAEGRVLILAPEDLYGLNTLKKNFEGLEMMYRKGVAAELQLSSSSAEFCKLSH